MRAKPLISCCFCLIFPSCLKLYGDCRDGDMVPCYLLPHSDSQPLIRQGKTRQGSRYCTSCCPPVRYGYCLQRKHRPHSLLAPQKADISPWPHRTKPLARPHPLPGAQHAQSAAQRHRRRVMAGGAARGSERAAERDTHLALFLMAWPWLRPFLTKKPTLRYKFFHT